jgi:hypothetical protein
MVYADFVALMRFNSVLNHTKWPDFAGKLLILMDLGLKNENFIDFRVLADENV